MTHAERQAFLKRSRLGQVAGVSHLLPKVAEETKEKQGVNGTNIIDLAISASVVAYVFGQTTEGALQKFCADVLKGLIYTKFAGRAELRQASEHPKVLEAIIEEEASKDDIFREQLEQLVTTFQLTGVSHLLPKVAEETKEKQGVNGTNIMDLAILASAAVYFFAQTTGGALEKLGADVVDQLKGLIYTKFAGRAELRQASENPKILEAVIEEEASRDDIFRKQLEELVTRLQQIENNRPIDNVYQNAGESGVNQKIDSVSGGTVSGRDQIGRDQTNFRH
ncbi:hypothetical protein [Microcoleus sp. FACHB-672]|uniref:hypothetical protein n=1 Tax=Microcoleus sp. FACHB-672 TaxID=2692825 RepID=UPI0018EF4E0E|nr:hypothetical protein [Microcoleus sp. FACHB-672]